MTPEQINAITREIGGLLERHRDQITRAANLMHRAGGDATIGLSITMRTETAFVAISFPCVVEESDSVVLNLEQPK